MRSVLVCFAMWLCRALNVNPLNHERINNGSDAVERGARWESFYREQNGLADMIQAVRRGYFEGASALGMNETAKLYEYALADRIAREIDRQVQGVIASGKIEAEQIAARARASVAQIRR